MSRVVDCVEVKVLREGAQIPRRMTEGAAGFDLFAAPENGGVVALPAGGRALVGTGVAVAIPAGFEGQVRPRSGLALRHGVTVLNAPGTIDADYRGELKVLLVNLGDETFEVAPGDRIAQLVVAAVSPAQLEQVRLLSAPAGERGTGGFGSTGGFGRGA